MRKVLITLASILAVAGIILLNALTFSGRYARMMETSITVTSADDSFIGKKMKEFFARENLEEKLAHEMESLPLFPDHPEYHEELASLAVSLGRDTSLEQVRCQGHRYYGGYRVSLSLPKEEFQLWKDRFKENLPEDRLSSITNRDSSHIRLRKFTGWEEKSEDGDIPYVQGSASFLLTGGGMTQLVYITAVIIEKEEDVLLALFISDHKQDTKGIPFGKMAELPPAGAEDS